MLSRALILAGLPALVIVVTGLFVFTVPTGASVSRPVLAYFLPAIVAIGFVPLAVLLAFVLRIATVSQRTAAMVPFRTPRQGRKWNSASPVHSHRAAEEDESGDDRQPSDQHVSNEE